MPLPSILADAGLFFLLVFGLGLVLPGPRLEPLERLTWTAASGLIVLYLGAWALYLSHAPTLAWWGLPVLAAGGCWRQWRAARELFGDVRIELGRLALFSGWGLGWLALIRSYGGGEWVGDWLEHYQRARFLMDHQPLTTRFLDLYSFTARPPLANLVVAAGLELRGPGFAHAQVFLTLFGTLTLLPALLLARHFGGDRRRNAVLLAMLMMSPMVLQNATFAWTKLPSAFFVLTALALFARGWNEPAPARRLVAVAAMAAAVLTHYSAAPYAIGLGAWYLVRCFDRRARAGSAVEPWGAVVLFFAICATWLGWAWWRLGAAATFLDNTSVTTDAGLPASVRVGLRLNSLLRTLIPHPLLHAEYRYLAQFSREGYWRDYAFTIYQTTLTGAIGLSGWLWLAGGRRRATPAVPGPTPRHWLGFTLLVCVLNFAIVSWADRWGGAHLGFIPLVIGVLAFLSGRSEPRSRFWLCAWGLAIATDFALGIAIHFHLQATAVLSQQDIARFLHGETFTYSHAVARNALYKTLSGTSFVGDGGPSPALVVALLATLAAIAVRSVIASVKRDVASPHGHG